MQVLSPSSQFMAELMHPAQVSPDTIFLAVVVPTYKRPDMLRATLESLTAQTARAGLAVIVVENDAAGSAGSTEATRFFGVSHLPGAVVIEPKQGNCNAYNAGFAAALAHYPQLTHIAIIDDDEVARPDWLERLLAAAARTGADIVGGPQVPHFESVEGARLYARHPVFRPSHDQSGRAGLITSTGNCLISVAVLRAMGPQWLDPQFNFMGGGDTDFFTRCRAKGFTFAWAADAAVDEVVPARRTSRDWITARSLRNGMISALIQRKQNPGLWGRITIIAKSFALLAVSPFRGIKLWAQTGSAYAGSYHTLIALGRLAAEFGLTVEQYRQPEKN
jgi:GT2 family glycosyltransferase